jgi:methionyl-tRNA formyltransferase
MSHFVVATTKPWNVAAFEKRSPRYAGEWHLIEGRADLTAQAMQQVNPRYIFFPHWSWIVPREILDRWDCVCFHMTDVPYGRGGSPLQNLIVRGHKTTVLSALRMTEDLDAGPVYLKEELDLRGSAGEIYARTAELVFDLIERIAAEEPAPTPQQGAVTTFKRRTPEESRLPQSGGLDRAYDHIRMLDAETYPPAFLDYGDYRIEFDNAELQEDGVLRAQVAMHIRNNEPDLKKG